MTTRELLVVPPPQTLCLTDGRQVPYHGDVDGSAIAGAPLVVRRWMNPKSGLKIAVSSDATIHGQLLHASVSYPGHLPSWRDVRVVKDTLFVDDVDAAMVLTQRSDYVNVHQFCFHIWQLPIAWGIR